MITPCIQRVKTSPLVGGTRWLNGEKNVRLTCNLILTGNTEDEEIPQNSRTTVMLLQTPMIVVLVTRNH